MKTLTMLLLTMLIIAGCHAVAVWDGKVKEVEADTLPMEVL